MNYSKKHLKHIAYWYKMHSPYHERTQWFWYQFIIDELKFRATFERWYKNH